MSLHLSRDCIHRQPLPSEVPQSRHPGRDGVGPLKRPVGKALETRTKNMIKSSEKTPEVKCTDFFDGLVGRLIFRISTLMGDVYVTTRFLWLFQLDDEPNHYKKNGCFTKHQ